MVFRQLVAGASVASRYMARVDSRRVPASLTHTHRNSADGKIECRRQSFVSSERQKQIIIIMNTLHYTHTHTHIPFSQPTHTHSSGLSSSIRIHVIFTNIILSLDRRESLAHRSHYVWKIMCMYIVSASSDFYFLFWEGFSFTFLFLISFVIWLQGAFVEKSGALE